MVNPLTEAEVLEARRICKGNDCSHYYEHAGEHCCDSLLPRALDTIDALQAEIAKCVVLCSNCHKKVHAGIVSL